MKLCGLSETPGKFRGAGGEESGEEQGSPGRFRLSGVGTDWARQRFPKGSKGQPGTSSAAARELWCQDRLLCQPGRIGLYWKDPQR